MKQPSARWALSLLCIWCLEAPRSYRPLEYESISVASLGGFVDRPSVSFSYVGSISTDDDMNDQVVPNPHDSYNIRTVPKFTAAIALYPAFFLR